MPALLWVNKLMDRLLPVPFALICIFVAATSETAYLTIALCALFLGVNLLISKVQAKLIKKYLFLHILRYVITGIIYFFVMISAGPESPSWLIGLPMIIASCFIFENMVYSTTLTLFIVAVAAAAQLENGVLFVNIAVSAVCMIFISATGTVAVSKIREKELTSKRLSNRLREANKELEQFAYIASHDLQEPLRMVTSYLELIDRRNKNKLDSDTLEFMGFALDGAQRMRQLIEGLLCYSRLNRGLNIKDKLDCNCVLQIIETNLKMIIEKNSARIIYEKLPIIRADEQQLLSLFQNLVSNAIKFCPNRIPVVKITAEQKDDMWLFKISDNGVGVEQKHFDRIFRIFQRLHTKEEYPGTGIGLAACKKIVERHGGSIWLESEEGKGSDFFFTVPR